MKLTVVRSRRAVCSLCLLGRSLARWLPSTWEGEKESVTRVDLMDFLISSGVTPFTSATLGHLADSVASSPPALKVVKAGIADHCFKGILRKRAYADYSEACMSMVQCASFSF